SGGGTTGRVAGVRANGDGEPLHGAARAGNDSLMSRSILLVDDDRGFSSLAREGHPVVLARSLHEAREAVERAAPELVVLDRRLPDGDGLDYLPELKAQLPGTPVVMVTAHGDIQSAVDAIRAGASDYVAKPVDLTDLVMRAQRA